jgi:hypothetical protein
MRKITRRLRTAIHKTIDTIKPYTVSICDGTDLFEHKAWTFKEALTWVAAYPTYWGTALITRKGWTSHLIKQEHRDQLIAARHGLPV